MSRYDKTLPLPRTLVEGFATGQVWFRYGSISAWTDGWFLFAPDEADRGVRVRPTKAYPSLPNASVIGVRAFDKIELLGACQTKPVGEPNQERWLATDIACNAARLVMWELRKTFKVKYVDMFSVDLLEHVLVDLDTWCETRTKPEIDDLATVIQTAQSMRERLIAYWKTY